jgi:hypothetical protein
MKTLTNEDGIVLVTSLLFTLLSLAIVMTLLYIVGQGMNLSASSKRYRSALSASHGGVEVVARELIPKLFSGTSTSTLESDFSGLALDFPASACLQDKLTKSTSAWGVACEDGNKTSNPKLFPDMTFQLKGGGLQPGYNVYAKVVDTMPGNTDTSGIDYLDSGAGVTGGSSGVTPQHIPAKYRLEVQAESIQNTREKAELSVLYAY